MENIEKLGLDPQIQLEKLLLELELVEWDHIPQRFKAFFQNNCNSCSLEDFAIYYLAALRQHTDLHFRSCNETETPKCQTPVRNPKPNPNASDQDLNDSNLSQLSNLSLNNASTTTPVRQQQQQQQARRSTGHQFSSTPQSSDRSQVNRSGGGGAAGNNICLGDFLHNTTPNQSLQRSKKKLTPQETTNSSNNKSQKPRRRVLPMTISKNVSSCSSFGDTSSFSNENNLWRLSQSSELLDQSQGAALEQEARKSLLLHRQEIKSEASVATTVEQDRERDLPTADVVVSLEDVSHKKQLKLLAAIYGQLLDLNSVPNVLSEISFALNLLNIQPIVGSPISEPKHNKPEPLSLLSQYKECIYFAATFLEHQKDLLLQLDRKSLVVLLQHDRLLLLSNTLQQQLEVACQLKREVAGNQTEAIRSSTQHQNVYYQHDKDSRDNFPSQNEFGAFKTQRDLFYKAFKHWEQIHLNRVFSFSREVAPLVRDIFKQSEHAVNMAHLAKLCVSQLLMSRGETNELPEELGLKLDQLRLNKLAQRLVTSNSSVEDQFPRTQAFFRDFINECGSFAFLVQLQLALYVQLLRHNDSSFELLPLQPDEETEMATPYIVRPQAMAEMLLLAKFLGYVCALPYNRSPTAYACPQQLQLRSQFQPPFDMRTHLMRAMQQGKLLITLPWLVQYLAMLDLVTLQLPASLATMEILYTLYTLAVPQQRQHLQPVAVLITRICLGWLLESQPTLCNGYYTQRTSKAVSGGKDASVALVSDCLLSFCISDKSTAASSMIEQLLPVACPFLHEFRVAIASSQRQAQRNGRYRYITTRLEQLSGSTNVPNNTTEQSQSQDSLMEQQQRKLTEAFLHSQSASMRRMLEFVTERTFKCVVKDAQHEILLPSKSSADALVNEISSTQQHEVQRELQRIYQQARTQATKQWSERVPVMLDKRIEQSLLALLPANTHDVLRRTYAHLIRQQAIAQLQHWLQINVLQSNFYHGDLQEVASKVCRANKNSAQVAAVSSGVAMSNELCLPEDCELSLSELLHDLQKWVHCLCLRPDHLHHLCDLQKMIDIAKQAMLLPKLPSYFYQLVGSTLVRLLQLIICRQPQMLTQPLMHACCDVWLAPQLRSLYAPASPDFFPTLLSVSFIHELSANPANFHLLEQLLHIILETRVLRLDEINEYFITLFKENWSPPVWAALSQLLQKLSQHRGTGDGDTNAEDDSKSQLFMEMLSDLSRDLDSF